MPTLVIVSVSDRVDWLNKLMANIKQRDDVADWKVALLFQDYAGTKHRIAHRDRYDKIIIAPERLGCHAARVQLLRQIEDDAYVNLDDDMTPTEHTHWQPAVDKALEYGNGFVLTAWAQNWGTYRNRLKLGQGQGPPDGEFGKGIMLYQGGGMAYSNDVADLMRALPAVPSRYDDIWPLTAYINGYQSWRYYGSLALHTVCRKGGMHDYMMSDDRPLLCWDWIEYRPVANFDEVRPGMEWRIPEDRDLRPEARARHKEARAKLMEGAPANAS